MNKQNQDLLRDYSEFLNSSTSKVPEDLNTTMLLKLRARLFPSSTKVFLKILGIHIVTGYLSLALCNQFGLNPFKTSHSLSDLFMDIGGHGFCMIACGVLFVSLSVFLSGLCITKEETYSLRKTEFIQILNLGLISLGFFISLGAEVALIFGGLWLLGAFVGGIIATEILWFFKKA